MMADSVDYNFNIARRVTSRSNQPDVKYLYDNALGDAATAYSWGRVRQVNRIGYGTDAVNSNGHGYTYDFKGRPYTDVVTTTTTYSANTYIVSYLYDSGDRLTRSTYPSQAGGEPVSFT